MLSVAEEKQSLSGLEHNVKAARTNIPLAVMAPAGGVVLREAPLCLAVTLPLGELLLCPKPAGSVRKPQGVLLKPVLPEKGEPLAVALPLEKVCIPADYRKCKSQYITYAILLQLLSRTKPYFN